MTRIEEKTAFDDIRTEMTQARCLLDTLICSKGFEEERERIVMQIIEDKLNCAWDLVDSMQQSKVVSQNGGTIYLLHAKAVMQ